jgi:hypothetical protein
MTQPHTTERRAYPRRPAQAGIRFYHAASRRELPARTLNVSRGGLAMLVPSYVPVREGQSIQILSLPPLDGEGPRGDGLEDDAGPRDLERPLDAAVLRVDRASILATGQVQLSVRFHRPQ